MDHTTRKSRRMREKCRMWVLLAILAQVLLLSGCGTPQLEYDSADAAKEALNTAEHIEIYCDLYTPSSKTEIVADGNAVGTGYAGKKNIGYFRRVYTNVYRTEFDTDPGAHMYVDFMDRIAKHKKKKNTHQGV